MIRYVATYAAIIIAPKMIYMSDIRHINNVFFHLFMMSSTFKTLENSLDVGGAEYHELGNCEEYQ